MEIRNYKDSDYDEVKKLYDDSGWFDSETDAQSRLKNKIDKNSDSILVAVIENKIVGTVSFLEDSRIAILFRLVSPDKNIREKLIEAGINNLKSFGYKEVHIIAPEEDKDRQSEYEELGFKKGKIYQWMWRKIV